MKITHIGLWTEHLEELKTFYTTWFKGTSHEKYTNPRKGFSSYFIRFEGEVSLELMSRAGIRESRTPGEEVMGFAHLAFSVGSPEEVTALTEQLREAGYTVAGEPRTTGDGFFESVVLDPDGNRIELTV